MTRRKPEERHDGYLPEEKLSLTEAIELFTLGGAKAAGESGSGNDNNREICRFYRCGSLLA